MPQCYGIHVNRNQVSGALFLYVARARVKWGGCTSPLSPWKSSVREGVTQAYAQKTIVAEGNEKRSVFML